MFLSNKKYNTLLARIDALDNTRDIMLRENKENAKLLSDAALKKKAAYALNLCTVSVSQIIDYNDIYILEQEYEAILNNLNLQEFIKDEALLNVLKQILDTITFFKIQESDKESVEKEYKQKMKNAIWSAVPNFGVILAGGSPVQMAITLATQVGAGYMNYRKNKSQYALDRDKQEWELQRSAIEQFNGLRRELFETAWRLSDKFKFDDALRLTEKQISHYNAILIDSDPLRRFEKLDAISETFGAFPPFWYFKGNAAREIFCDETFENVNESFKKKALEAFRKFDDIYVNFMREDVLAASCALEHISLLDVEKDRDKISKLLERATSLAGDNFDILQMCVLVYIAIKRLSDAKGILRRLINEEYNLGLNGLWLSRIYCIIDKNQSEYEILKSRIGESYVMPWIEDDEESEKKYIESRGEEVKWRFYAFTDEFAQKYMNKFENDFDYKNCDDLPSRLICFKDSNLVYTAVETLNGMFSETENLRLFNDSKICNITWPDVFERAVVDIDKQLKNFIKDDSDVRDFINSCNRIHRTRKGHSENIAMYNKIQELIEKHIPAIYSTLPTKLKETFSQMFNVKTAESADSIINEIDRWYMNNNISISKKHCEVDQNSSINVSKKYFNYNNYKKFDIE